MGKMTKYFGIILIGVLVFTGCGNMAADQGGNSDIESSIGVNDSYLDGSTAAEGGDTGVENGNATIEGVLNDSVDTTTDNPTESEATGPKGPAQPEGYDVIGELIYQAKEVDMTLAQHRYDGNTLYFYGGELVTEELVDEALAEYGLDKWTFKSLVIEDGIVRIGDNAFFDCAFLEQMDFPSGLRSIGDGAFRNCSIDAVINLPDGLESVGNFAFQSTGSGDLVIPDSVTSIGAFAFDNCNWTSIKIPSDLVHLGAWAFDNCELPTSQLPPYCYTILSDTEIIYNGFPTGTHPLSDAYRDDICWGKIPISLLGRKVVALGDYAFAWLGDQYYIEVPEGIRSIGEGAFQHNGIWNISLPDTLRYIGDYAFHDCSVDDVIIPNSVKSIGEAAFKACKAYNIILPDTLEYMGEYAFGESCWSDNVTIPSGITSVPPYAYYGIGLEKLEIPQGVTHIEEGAFAWNYLLTEVIVPETVVSIGSRAFYGCEELEKVVLPASVTSIADDCFDYSDSLKTIIAPSGSYAEEWAKEAGLVHE